MVRIKRTRTAKVRKVFSSSSENDSSEPDAKSKERRTKTARHVDSAPTSNSPGPNPSAVPKSAEEVPAKFGRRRNSRRIATARSDDDSLGAAAEPSTCVSDSSMELCRTSLGTPPYATTVDACVAETPPAKRRHDSPGRPGSNSPRASTPKASPELTSPGDVLFSEQSFSEQSSCDEQVRGQVSAIIDSLPGVDGLDSSEAGTVAGPADPDRPLEGAKVHVEVRCGSQDLSGTLEAILEKLGAEVCDTVGPQLTHVVFRKGRDSTRDTALRWNIPLVGPLWVEGCRVEGRAVSPAKYPAVAPDTDKRRMLHMKHESAALQPARKAEGLGPPTQERHAGSRSPASPAATSPRSSTAKSRSARRVSPTLGSPSTLHQPSTRPKKVGRTKASPRTKRSTPSKHVEYRGDEENHVVLDVRPLERRPRLPDGALSEDGDFVDENEKSKKGRLSSGIVEVPKIRRGSGAAAVRMRDCQPSQEGKDQGPSVVMTSVPPEDRVVLRSVVLALGGFRVEAEVTPGTTHLVVGGAVRTLNLLLAMARGCWVLSTDWVYRSLEAGHWLDERPFELGNMFPAVRLSRQERAVRGEGGLLAGTGAFYVSPESRPPPDKMRQLVQILGGKVALSYLRCNVALGPVEASRRRPDVRHVSEKWLLDSVSEHRVLPFSGYS
ncbi:microcephalin [Ixodes scapularis]|uniref:microcephalin n=1 Tax=Ixodes scapularis TaxID=6945 RepID=UPI001C390D0E|nr:microcephalin [Ixodes scapularis]